MSRIDQRAAPLVLAGSSVLMLSAFLVGGRPAEWLFALLAATFPVALIALGARRGVPGRGICAALALTLGVSAVLLLVLSERAPGPTPSFGLPWTVVVMLVGLGAAPLILVTWAHAATFDERSARLRKPPPNSDPTG